MAFNKSPRRYEYEYIMTSHSWSEHDLAWMGVIHEFMSDPRRPKRWKRKYDAYIRKHVDSYNRLIEQVGGGMPAWVPVEAPAYIKWPLISIVLCSGMSQKQLFTLLHLAYPAPQVPWRTDTDNPER